MSAESPTRIEPCELESLPATLSNAIVELGQRTAVLGSRIHPQTEAFRCFLGNSAAAPSKMSRSVGTSRRRAAK